MKFPEEAIYSPKEFADDVAAKARTLAAQKNLAQVDPDRILLMDLLAKIHRAPEEYSQEANSILEQGYETSKNNFHRRVFFRCLRDSAFNTAAKNCSNENIEEHIQGYLNYTDKAFKAWIGNPLAP